LFETKVASNQTGVVESAINNPSSMQFMSNVLDAIKCSILIGWDLEKFTCEVLSLVDKCNFAVTCVYGLNTPTRRQDL
jgi:hypothetical protein